MIAASLPFVNERLFVVGPLRRPEPLGLRLVELIVWCAAALGVGLAIEARLGQFQRQGWEFYIAMASLFLTLAFPGFVWRYLRRGA